MQYHSLNIHTVVQRCHGNSGNAGGDDTKPHIRPLYAIQLSCWITVFYAVVFCVIWFARLLRGSELSINLYRGSVEAPLYGGISVAYRPWPGDGLMNYIAFDTNVCWSRPPQRDADDVIDVKLVGGAGVAGCIVLLLRRRPTPLYLRTT